MEARREEEVDKGLRPLRQHRPRCAEGLPGLAGNREQTELELVLPPVDLLEGDAARLRRPGELGRDVVVVRPDGDDPLRPRRPVLLDADDPDPDHRVGRARLWVPLPRDLVLHREEVDDREVEDGRLVELEVGNGPRARRPDEGLSVAVGQLLLVDPVEPTVQQGVRSRRREPGLPAGLDLDRVEIVFPDEGHSLSVGRGGRELLEGLRLHEGPDRPRLRVDEVDIAARGDEKATAVGHPRGDVERVAPVLAAGERQRLPAEEDLLLPAAWVEGVHVGGASGRAQVREPLAVGVQASLVGTGPASAGSLTRSTVSFSTGAAAAGGSRAATTGRKTKADQGRKTWWRLIGGPRGWGLEGPA